MAAGRVLDPALRNYGGWCMTIFLGLAMVFGLVFGGFMLSGGKMDIVLYALPYEGMMIGGGAIGAFVVANSTTVLKSSLRGLGKVVKGPKFKAIRALTRASLAFFTNPPEGFADHPLLSPIDAAFVARADQTASLDAMEAELADTSTVRRVDAAELRRHLPLLREGYALGAIWDSGTSEIDVSALHQGYLRGFKAAGGTVLTNAPVSALTRIAEG